jgi:F420-dependent oxidoreductase-like protein
MSAPLQWGAFAPQGWKLEYSGWPAADAWARTKELAQLAERLGYHHLWVYDHFETVPRREPTHVFEAFTTLAALAQHTATIKLGQMVTCAAYRNAGLLAKEAACVDVFSGGRLILGLGAGWYEREYQAYGIPFPSAGVRLAILDETVEVVKRLWTEETVTYQGKHLAFDGAYCDPKPIQQLPELWIGGGGERVTLRIEARHADKTNWQVGLDAFVHKSELLRRYCDEIGRDFDEIVRTHGPDCRIFDTEADLRAWLDSPSGGSLRRGATPHDEYVRDNLVGTVEQVVEKAQAFVDAGCREFVLWFRDFPSSESLEAWARDVAPKIRS